MVIQTCTCNKLWCKAVQKQEMTELLSLGRTIAFAEIEVLKMEQTQQSAAQGHPRKNVLPVDIRRRSVKASCYNYSGSCEEMQCPAWGEICNACGKQGHFAKCCHSSQSHKVLSEVNMKCIMYTPVKTVASHLKQQVIQRQSSEEYLYAISQPKANLPLT